MSGWACGCARWSSRGEQPTRCLRRPAGDEATTDDDHPCRAGRIRPSCPNDRPTYCRSMSYPRPYYLGPAGELNATYRPAATPPELTYASGNTVHYLATGASTHGLFGLYRWEMGPKPSGPDPHFHRSISESFYI